MFLPISMISVFESIVFHIQRQNFGSKANWKENNMIYDTAKRWMKGYVFNIGYKSTH